MFNSRIRDAFGRLSLFIAYSALVVGAVVGFVYMQAMNEATRSLAERIELEGMIRAHENCESINEARMVVAAILERLAQARDDDGPGDFEARQGLLREFDDILDVRECPPPPPPPLDELDNLDDMLDDMLHEGH